MHTHTRLHKPHWRVGFYQFILHYFLYNKPFQKVLLLLLSHSSLYQIYVAATNISNQNNMTLNFTKCETSLDHTYSTMILYYQPFSSHLSRTWNFTGSHILWYYTNNSSVATCTTRYVYTISVTHTTNKFIFHNSLALTYTKITYILKWHKTVWNN